MFNNEQKITMKSAWKRNMILWAVMVALMPVAGGIAAACKDSLHGVIAYSGDLNGLAKGIIFLLVFGILAVFGVNLFMGMLGEKDLKSDDPVQAGIRVERLKNIVTMICFHLLFASGVVGYMMGLKGMEAGALMVFPLFSGAFFWPKSSYIQRVAEKIINYQKYYAKEKGPEPKAANKIQVEQAGRVLGASTIIWWAMALVIPAIVGAAHIWESPLHGLIQRMSGKGEMPGVVYVAAIVMVAGMLVIPWTQRITMFAKFKDAGHSGELPLLKIALTYKRSMITALAIFCAIACAGMLLFMLGAGFIMFYALCGIAMVCTIMFYPRSSQLDAIAARLSKEM